MSKKKTLIGVLHGPHSGDEKDIFLVKSDPSHDVYSDMDSVSGDSRDNDVFFGVGNGFFLGLATNTSKIKKVNTNLVFDLKIVKSQVEMSVRKSFVLDINLSVVEGKSAMAKTQFIRKIFSSVNSFGKANIPSKFEGII
ncbi:hypothetical protein G9A89_007908 [Geosiphon pyriformis]|nr:hypothetical protein G9A89_007908 [Geosiphon pyriformis]